MLAAWYTRNGEARDVLVVGDLPTPSPGPGEVRVKIAASGINPSDVKGRRSRPLGTFDRIIPHSDGSGVIDAVGRGVPAKRLGERVWIWNGQWKRPDGTAAEYIVLPTKQAQPLPDNVSYAAGACIGIPVLTAFHAVSLLGDIAGKTVLVTGAASGVGYYATQIAARIGKARVVGTVGSPERGRLAELAGASALIDYKTQAVPDVLKELTGGRGADAIVDLDFSSTAPLLEFGILAPHGQVVVYGSNAAIANLPMRRMTLDSLRISAFLVYDLTPRQRRVALKAVGELLSRDRLDHAIAAEFPLADIAAAHVAVEAGRSVGKICLRVS